MYNTTVNRGIPPIPTGVKLTLWSALQSRLALVAPQSHKRGQIIQIVSSLPPKRDCGSTKGSSSLVDRKHSALRGKKKRYPIAARALTVRSTRPAYKKQPDEKTSTSRVFGERSTPFRTAVPFWGQITWNLSGLAPKRDCGSKGDNNFGPLRNCAGQRALHYTPNNSVCSTRL